MLLSAIFLIVFHIAIQSVPLDVLHQDYCFQKTILPMVFMINAFFLTLSFVFLMKRDEMYILIKEMVVIYTFIYHFLLKITVSYYMSPIV